MKVSIAMQWEKIRNIREVIAGPIQIKSPRSRVASKAKAWLSLP